MTARAALLLGALAATMGASALLLAADRTRSSASTPAHMPRSVEESRPALRSEARTALPEELVPASDVTRTEVPVATEPAGEELALAASRELAELVGTVRFTPGVFALEARALAARLGPGVAAELARIAAEEALEPSVRIAAAELLRAHAEADDVPVLDAAALSVLREAALAGAAGADLRAAAGPALAAFGEQRDRERLLAVLAQVPEKKEDPDAEAARADAARALRAARDRDSAAGLARILGSADERGAALAAVALGTRLAAGTASDARDEVIEALAAALAAPHAETVHVRAAGALGLADAPAASEALARALDHTEAAPDVARAVAAALGRTDRGREELRVRLSGEPREVSVAAAEVLLLADPDGPDGWAARAALLDAAREPGASLLRTRAVAALREVGGADVEAHLAQLAAHDADPLVRATAGRLR